MTVPRPSVRSIAVVAAICLPAFVLGVAVYRQGFNFLDDGLWLLGAKLVGDGEILYRDLFSIYGPARYLLLLPVFAVVGKSALALAVLKALTDAVAGAVAWIFARRLGAGRLAWLAPLAVVALGPQLPRYVAAALFALLVARALGGDRSQRDWLVVGFGWAALSHFGLDVAGYGGVILVLSLILHRASQTFWKRCVPALAGGLVVGLLPLVIWLAATGALGAAWWDMVVYPLTRFSGEMDISPLGVLVDHPELGQPFAHVYDGLPATAAWHGQSAMLAWSVRLLYVAIWLIAPLCLWRWWWRRQPPAALAAPAVALAFCGWVTLLGRSDIPHMKMAWLGSLLLLPALLATLHSRPALRQAVAIALALLMLGPALGEKLWLVSHTDRPGLRLWERESARVLLSGEMIDVIEADFAALGLQPDEHALIWPAQPGLHFAMDVPPATPQVTLLGGEVRDEEAVVADLRHTRPRWFVQGRSRGLMAGIRTIDARVPAIWNYLRWNYWIPPQLNVERDGLRTITRLPGNEREDRISAVRLLFRLAHIDHTVSNSRTPALEPGIRVGQVLRASESGFCGMVSLWDGDVEGTEFTVITKVHDIGPMGGPRLLAQRETAMRLRPGRDFCECAFEPIRQVAGQEILVTLEIAEQPAHEVHVRWNVPYENEAFVDYYPDGNATWRGHRIPGDLYFLSY